MLARFKKGDGFIYINPNQVFAVGGKGEEKTIILSGGEEENYVIVDEPIDRVAMRLNDAARR